MLGWAAGGPCETIGPLPPRTVGPPQRPPAPGTPAYHKRACDRSDASRAHAITSVGANAYALGPTWHARCQCGVRPQRTEDGMEVLGQDVRHALKALRRDLGF